MISKDGRFWWDGAKWRQLSDDRLWWWDGTAWQPVREQASQLAAGVDQSPVDQSSVGGGQETKTDLGSGVRLAANGAVITKNGIYYHSGLRWHPLVDEPPVGHPGIFSAEQRSVQEFRKGKSNDELSRWGEQLRALIADLGSLETAEAEVTRSPSAGIAAPPRALANGAVITSDGNYFYTGLRWRPFAENPASKHPGFTEYTHELRELTKGRSVGDLTLAGEAVAEMIKGLGSLQAAEGELTQLAEAGKLLPGTSEAKKQSEAARKAANAEVTRSPSAWLAAPPRALANGAVITGDGNYFYTGLRWRPFAENPASKHPGFTEYIHELRELTKGRSPGDLTLAAEAVAEMIKGLGSLQAAEGELTQLAEAGKLLPGTPEAKKQATYQAKLDQLTTSVRAALSKVASPAQLQDGDSVTPISLPDLQASYKTLTHNGMPAEVDGHSIFEVAQRLKTEIEHRTSLQKSVGIDALYLRYMIETKGLSGNNPPRAITPQRGELEYSAYPARLARYKTFTSWQGGSSGVSIPLGHGFRYRVGSYSGHAVSQEKLVVIDQGKLALTNQRVVFVGQKQSISIPLAHVSHLQAFRDGLEIAKEGRESMDFYFIQHAPMFVFLFNYLLQNGTLSPMTRAAEGLLASTSADPLMGAPPAPDPSSPETSKPAARPPTASSQAQALAALKELAELHQQGVLTEAEFEAKKAELLARI
jgi:Short C-terminal domain